MRYSGTTPRTERVRGGGGEGAVASLWTKPLKFLVSRRQPSPHLPGREVPAGQTISPPAKGRLSQAVTLAQTRCPPRPHAHRACAIDSGSNESRLNVLAWRDSV